MSPGLRSKIRFGPNEPRFETRRGIAEALILKTLDYGREVLKYHGAELSWTLEDNDLINRTIQRVGGVHYKTYRTYRSPIHKGTPNDIHNTPHFID